MTGVTRFGVSMDSATLAKLDSMAGAKGYASRSEALRDLVRDAADREQAMSGRGEAVGTLTISYDHHNRSVTERMLDIEHGAGGLSVSKLHVHLDHSTCLEVIVLRGGAREVRETAGRIRAVKGVDNGELVMVPLESGKGKRGHHHDRK